MSPSDDPKNAQEPAGQWGVPAWHCNGDRVSLVRPQKPPRPVRVSASPANLELDLARCALLVVDMQNDFCHPEGWFGRRGVDLTAVTDVIPKVASAITWAKRQSVPVIRLNWGLRGDCLEMSPGQLALGGLLRNAEGYGDRPSADADANLVIGSWGADTLDRLAPENDEIVVHKKRFSGFWHNELDAVLRRLDVTTLLFAGINTDRCVLASLQDATFLGYDSLLIEDACATPSSEQVRESALVLIRKIYGFTTNLEALNALADA